MAKILQRLKTLKMCLLQNAEHPVKNLTSLAGLDQCLLLLGPPYIMKIFVRGLFKKKCQLGCSFVFCWSLLLFYSNMVHKQ